MDPEDESAIIILTPNCLDQLFSRAWALSGGPVIDPDNPTILILTRSEAF